MKQDPVHVACIALKELADPADKKCAKESKKRSQTKKTGLTIFLSYSPVKTAFSFVVESLT